MDLPVLLAMQFIRDAFYQHRCLYSLGSGGARVFDITIVFQSFIYDPGRRVMRSKVRRKSLGSMSGEEQRLLLSTDHRIEEAC